MTWSDVGAVFSGVLVLSFGVTILLAGMFTSYFGAGKSRKIGLGLILFGLLALFAWTAITFNIQIFASANVWTSEQMANGVAALVAGLVGGLVAMALFLVAIMRA